LENEGEENGDVPVTKKLIPGRKSNESCDRWVVVTDEGAEVWFSNDKRLKNG